MKATLTRFFQNESATFGNLLFHGTAHPPIFTLEEPWKNNAPRISCIPAGAYRAFPHGWERGTKLKMKRCWQLTPVPGRSGILIHVGNTTRDIEGCILVGLSMGHFRGLPAVLQSIPAMKLLRDMVGQQSFDLVIR